MCVCVNNPSSVLNIFPGQGKVRSEEEVPDKVPLRRAARRQPAALHEGMFTVFVSVCEQGKQLVMCTVFILEERIGKKKP